MTQLLSANRAINRSFDGCSAQWVTNFPAILVDYLAEKKWRSVMRRCSIFGTELAVTTAVAEHDGRL